MIFGFKDSLRQAVEAASGGLATVMYTPKGQPLFMRRITPFRLEDLAPDGSLGTGWHPAFPDGREFWVSIYRVCIVDSEPISVPGVAPSSRAYNVWENLPLPPGMKYLGITEWAALALIGTHTIRGDFIRGNSARGRSHEYPWETGVRVDGAPPGTIPGGRTLTGSGPVTWRHDHSPWGVELVGNEALLVVGVRLVLGQIQIQPDGRHVNPFTTPSEMWYAVNTTGALVAANTSEPTLGYTPSGRIGTQRGADIPSFSFGGMQAEAGLTIPPILRALGLAPSLYTRGNIGVSHQFPDGVRERLALRFGGHAEENFAAPGRINRGDHNFSFSALLVYRE